MKHMDQEVIVLRCSVCSKKLLDIGTQEADIVIKCPRCNIESQLDIYVDGQYYHRSETINLSNVVKIQERYA